MSSGNPRSNPLVGGGGGTPSGGNGSLDVLILENNALPAGTAAAPCLQFGNDAGKVGIYADANGEIILVKSGFNNIFLSTNAGTIKTRSGAGYYWANSTTDATQAADTSVMRDAAGVVKIGDGSTGRGWLQTVGDKRVTGDVTCTNSTALIDATGLSAALVAGRTYGFRAVLFATTVATSGLKVQLTASGGLTATDIIADFMFLNVAAAPPAYLNTTTTRTTSLGTSIGVTATGVSTQVIIEGTITVNVAGTMTVQFAQNAETGAAETAVIKRGSTLTLTDIA